MVGPRNWLTKQICINFGIKELQASFYSYYLFRSDAPKNTPVVILWSVGPLLHKIKLKNQSLNPV